MSLFNDILAADQTLFKDDTILDFDYIPTIVSGRDDEIKGIVESVKPLFFDKAPTNLFITGLPGIGKTLALKFVFNDLKQTSSDIIPCYINCWKNSTYHSVFVELSKFFGVPYPSKGVSTDEIIRGITKKIENKKGIVVAFDEIDKARTMDFLYPLIDGFGRKICLLLVSNYNNFLSKVDSRLLSRLNIENLDFKPYNRPQFENILKERVDYAFYPNVFEKDAFNTVVDKACTKKDVRLGISLLLKSGRRAESESSKKVKKEHVDFAIKNIEESLQKDRMKDLEDHEKKILDLLKGENGIITGDLYDKFVKTGENISMRTFRKYLNQLERSEFINTEDTGAGFRGKSRKIYLKNYGS
ncbi:ORC1-type DNA replication protein 2 [Candidatus Tiddalikarchaeum anstoanum]|nr:ORC1-type DNA replication protein 2 [Candidatus Tiddalikarchaeum anstoanum]